MDSGQSRQRGKSTHYTIREKLAQSAKLFSSAEDIKKKFTQSVSLFRSTDDIVKSFDQSSSTVIMYVDELVAPPREFDYWNVVPRFHVLPMTIFPLKNRMVSDYVMVEENSILSSHKVLIVRKPDAKDPDDFLYCKLNPLNSFMSVLEAFIAHCYQFLSNEHIIPNTRALLTDNFEYRGVASKGIRGAASIKKDPLKMEELEIKALKTGAVTVEELDKLDVQMQAEAIDLDKLPPEFKLERKLTFYTHEGGTKIPYQKNIRVTVKDLKNYRTIKTLAILITLSHILMEGDFHRNNIGKKGRWDFDMSLLCLLFGFKNHSWFGHRYRNPQVTKIETVSAEDILNMPDYKDLALFYGPCVPPPVELISYMVSKVTSLFSEDPYVIADNAFQWEDNAVFKLLKEHPVFIYHKFSVLTRFILSEGSMYKSIAELHIPADAKPEGQQYKDKTLIAILTDLLEGRIIKYTEVLTQMPEFADFIKDHGDTVIENIISDMARKNENLERKMMKIEDKIASHSAKRSTCNSTMPAANEKEKINETAEKYFEPKPPSEDLDDDGFIEFCDTQPEVKADEVATQFNDLMSVQAPKKTARPPTMQELIAKKQAYEKQFIELDFIRMKYTTLKKLILEEYEVKANPGASILGQLPEMDISASRIYNFSG